MSERIVAVVGPTASGKSAVAVELAKLAGGEVVSIDALQIYMGLRIGTARITLSESQGVPHHMIAICPPDEKFNAHDYVERAIPIIRSIIGRNKLPILAGGTGLYLNAIAYDMSLANVPPNDALREELGRLDFAALQARLVTFDRVSAERIKDKRRLVRAIEVVQATGVPMSAANDNAPRFDTLAFGLALPRDVLVRSIEKRTRGMFDAGLMEETEFLLNMGLRGDEQSMMAIGYREAALCLAGKITHEEAIERVNVATRQYAKRQMTWFKRFLGIEWVDMMEFGSARDAAGFIYGRIGLGR